MKYSAFCVSSKSTMQSTVINPNRRHCATYSMRVWRAVAVCDLHAMPRLMATTHRNTTDYNRWIENSAHFRATGGSRLTYWCLWTLRCRHAPYFLLTFVAIFQKISSFRLLNLWYMFHPNLLLYSKLQNENIYVVCCAVPGFTYISDRPALADPRRGSLDHLHPKMQYSSIKFMAVHRKKTKQFWRLTSPKLLPRSASGFTAWSLRSNQNSVHALTESLNPISGRGGLFLSTPRVFLKYLPNGLS